MLRFIKKHGITKIQTPVPPVVETKVEVPAVEDTAKKAPVKKNKVKESTNMEFETIKAVAEAMPVADTTKKIKKDKGLIERAESSKTIITEDYKQILMD